MAAITVKLNRLRQAPRKVRFLIDLIRGRDLATARSQLMASSRQTAARPLAKLLASAEAAAKDRGLEPAALRIAAITCDQGTALKRRQLKSKGRASQIKKFFSHVTLTVSDEASPKTVKLKSPTAKQLPTANSKN